MFKNSSSTKTRKPFRKQLSITAMLLAGMAGLWVLGKHEDKKIKRAFDDFQGE